MDTGFKYTLQIVITQIAKSKCKCHGNKVYFYSILIDGVGSNIIQNKNNKPVKLLCCRYSGSGPVGRDKIVLL